MKVTNLLPPITFVVDTCSFVINTCNKAVSGMENVLSFLPAETASTESTKEQEHTIIAKVTTASNAYQSMKKTVNFVREFGIRMLLAGGAMLFGVSQFLFLNPTLGTFAFSLGLIEASHIARNWSAKSTNLHQAFQNIRSEVENVKQIQEKNKENIEELNSKLDEDEAALIKLDNSLKNIDAYINDKEIKEWQDKLNNLEQKRLNLSAKFKAQKQETLQKFNSWQEQVDKLVTAINEKSYLNDAGVGISNLAINLQKDLSAGIASFADLNEIVNESQELVQQAKDIVKEIEARIKSIKKETSKATDHVKLLNKNNTSKKRIIGNFKANHEKYGKIAEAVITKVDVAEQVAQSEINRAQLQGFVFGAMVAVGASYLMKNNTA